MAFQEFADDISKEEVPQKFEGGNIKQRTKLNVLVKFAQAIADSLKRRGAGGDGEELPTTEFRVAVREAGGTSYFWVTMRRDVS